MPDETPDLVRDPLRRLGLLDGSPVAAFDRLTRLAARVFRAPIALVSAVDEGRQFFLSQVGFPEPWATSRELPLSHSLCQYVVGSEEALCVGDARTHPVLGDNRAVSELGFVAYLGVPIATETGLALGAICVIDTVPRAWSAADRATLRDLAAAAMTEVELRAEVAERRWAEDELRRARDELEERVLARTEALRASEERFRLLVEGVRDYAIVLLDPGGRVATWNVGAERIFGYTAAEAIGRHVATFYPPEEVARGVPADGLRSALERGRWAAEGERVRKDGSRFWASVTQAPLTDAAGRHVGFARVTRDVTERKRAEEALRLRERAIDAIAQGVCIADATRPDQPLVYVNRGFEALTGYPAAEVVGRNCRFLQGPGTDPEAVRALRDAVREGRLCAVELLNYTKAGAPFWNSLVVSPVRDERGRLTHFVAAQMDTTPFRKLEEQARQSQKMEAFGRLAGGVAHDFNNLLTVINGYSDMLSAALPSRGPEAEMLAEVSAAGVRAADLTRQLLAFSRKTVLQPKVVDPNELVGNLERMLTRLIGEDVRLSTALRPGIGHVRVDPGQMDQVIVNLAVNARDAMPAGGRLTLATDACQVGDTCTGDHSGVPPGRYVRVRVSDTGCGMSDEVQARLFEPFFTTKEVGKGTGLGLATVYGIVTQSGGHVTVESAVDRGTTFAVYLPAVARGDGAEAPASSRAGDEPPPAPTRSRETILLVEDDARVRAFAATVLRSGGYAVIEAGDGTEAVRAHAEYPGPVHLLLTDVVMPGFGGREVAERIIRSASGTQVLYMSGYTDDAIVRHGVSETDVAFLQKPFSPAALLLKVREVLKQT